MDLEKRIAELEQKLKETKEKAAKKAAAKKAQDLAEMKAATQRKRALAGEFLLDGAFDIGALVNAKNIRFDARLTHPADRKLFGFSAGPTEVSVPQCIFQSNSPQVPIQSSHLFQLKTATGAGKKRSV